MTTAVTKLYRFCASHRLHLPQLTNEENEQLYGKCNNPYGHGHDYVLEVTAEGPVSDANGQIIRPKELDSLVQERVLNIFDSKNINSDISQFRYVVPTTENISKVIAELLQSGWSQYVSGPARLSRVHVRETERNSFEVRMLPTARASAPPTTRRVT